MNTTTEVDQIAADELRLYVENDGQLYRSHLEPALVAVQRYWLRGRFDAVLAVRGVRRAVDEGARRYMRKFGSPGTSWYDVFNAATRTVTAETIVEHWRQEWQIGNRLGGLAPSVGCAVCGATDLPIIGHADECPGSSAHIVKAVMG